MHPFKFCQAFLKKDKKTVPPPLEDSTAALRSYYLNR